MKFSDIKNELNSSEELNSSKKFYPPFHSDVRRPSCLKRHTDDAECIHYFNVK